MPFSSAANQRSRPGGGRNGCSRWVGCGRLVRPQPIHGLCPWCRQRRQRPRPGPSRDARAAEEAISPYFWRALPGQ